MMSTAQSAAKPQSSECRISPAQLYTILILLRIMHTVIFNPDGFSMGTFLLPTIVLSTLVDVIISIPAVYLGCKGIDTVSKIAGNSLAARIILRTLYGGYFIYIAAGTICTFSELLEREFGGIVNLFSAMAVIIIAAAYCSYLGIEPIARVSGIVLWLFVLLTVFMTIVSEGSADTLNLAPPTILDLEKTADYFVRDISSSWWIPALVILSPRLNNSKNGALKSAAGYLVTKFIFLEALVTVVILVLGRFSDVTGYPILSLGAYARTVFIRNFDAVNMFVWSLCCVIVCGVYIYIAAGWSGHKHKAVRGGVSAAIGAVALTIGSVAHELGLEFNEGGAFAIKLAGIILLGVIIPCALIVRMKIKAMGRRLKNA